MSPRRAKTQASGFHYIGGIRASVGMSVICEVWYDSCFDILPVVGTSY